MTEFAIELLTKHYCRPGETIPEAFKRASDCFATDTTHSSRLQQYLKDEWFMFSSPVLSNAVLPGEKVKGLPISCFLTHVDDSIDGLCNHSTEFRWLSVKGGGVGGHWNDVRSMSEITPGAVGFMKSIDTDTVIYKQGKTRRGSYAAYLMMYHPEIIDFIKMRLPTGDLNRKSLNLHHGVNITDDFIDAVDRDAMWGLVDPHSGEQTETIRARELWEEVLTTRFRTGEPYINNLDEANDRMHPAQKKLGLKINGSNLCNEIHLPTSDERTAVCCLSSVNLVKYDEWKDNEFFIPDLIEMLDNVLQFFIDNAPTELDKAKFSAERERALGLGAMGFTDYLQYKGVPFESSIAISINNGIFKNIKKRALQATTTLAYTRGEAPDGIGYGVRNLYLLAIAPNANSSIIMGVSPSIEPRTSNCYIHKTRVGSYLVKNPQLEAVLERLGLNTEEVWKDILANEGSIQDIDYIPTTVKEVFKTAYELDQRYVIDHARVRQEHICQGQSVNTFFPAGTDKEYLSSVHLRAFRTKGLGVPLKGLYYLRTTSSSKVEKVSLKIQRDILQDGVQGDLDGCIACES